MNEDLLLYGSHLDAIQLGSTLEHLFDSNLKNETASGERPKRPNVPEFALAVASDRRCSCIVSAARSVCSTWPLKSSSDPADAMRANI